jgi:asparagine synthase (glutamine-hydrolysing)
MPRIAGIIYPNAFQVTEMIGEMHTSFPSRVSFEYFHHKNLELGGWDAIIATNEARDVRALLDGEIYNRKELTDELKKLGYKFNTESDSELIVHAYDAWGEEFLQFLNGPFALAVFDEKKEFLLLARDRVGQKSLFWTAQGDYWLFSTELKGLISTGIVPQTPSNEAFASFLYFGFIPQDLAAIQGVNKLLPCHFLKVDLKRQSVIGQYWSLSTLLQSKKLLSREETYEQLGKKLEEAVRISLPQEGTIGTFLVGNLGSSAMAWFLSHVLPRERIHTFSAVFDEPEPKELQLSSEIAKTLSLSHKSKRIEPDEVLDELPKVVWYLDEPIADPFALQTWHLGKIAGEGCPHAYADLGWEEMLGGSSRYFATEEKKSQPVPSIAFFLARLPDKIRDRIVLPILKKFRSDYLYRVLRNIDINREQVAYLMQTALFKGRSRKKVSPMLYEIFDPEVFAQRFHRLSSLPGTIDPSLYYDAKTELPDRLLVQFERLLDPHHVQVINPFLDFRLVEFLAEIPEEIKFESKMPGAILHHLMERLCHSCPPFPERSGSFMDTWCNNPRFREAFKLLLKGRLVDEGLISGRWIRQQLGYPYLIPTTFKQLWALMILEIWFRLYISRPIDMAATSLTTEELLSQR